MAKAKTKSAEKNFSKKMLKGKPVYLPEKINEDEVKKISDLTFEKSNTPMRFNGKDNKIDWKSTSIKEKNSVADIFKKITGTTESELGFSILESARHALPGNEIIAANNAIQALVDEKPQNAVEARLIAQQNALFFQGMAYLSRAENSNMLPHTELYLKSAVKLLRLHNETIEALCRYRRGGEQKVLVQHLHVEGQAIVNSGNMVAGVGENKNSTRLSHDSRVRSEGENEWPQAL